MELANVMADNETEQMKLEEINSQVIDSQVIEKLNNCYLKESAQKDPFSISIHYNQDEIRPIQWLIKRLIDVTGTLIGGVLISPILLAIAAAIRIESKGPILFRQKRIGKNGKEFNIYKFRSMYEDAEERLQELMDKNETNECMFKLQDDPRITKVGKFIRKYSLDELAQLINVLKGEMSLVGFRPPIPRELSGYKEWHYLRFANMPGLTGPWQVNGRSSIKKFDKVVELEFDYTKDWNIFKDFKILFRTVPIVIFGRDAS